ncbi:hypothetical protein CPB97_008784 [Podila verticillata]|nr:hypothetical protein CPB97_008784 [Podila verticillata]
MAGVAAGSSAPTTIPDDILGPSCLVATIGCYTIAKDDICDNSKFTSWLAHTKIYTTKARDYFFPPQLNDEKVYCFRPYTEQVLFKFTDRGDFC